MRSGLGDDELKHSLAVGQDRDVAGNDRRQTSCEIEDLNRVLAGLYVFEGERAVRIGDPVSEVLAVGVWEIRDRNRLSVRDDVNADGRTAVSLENHLPRDGSSRA